MRVAEAVVGFVGDMSHIDKDLEGVATRAEPVAKKVGAMFSTNVSTGLMAGGAAMATVGGFLIAAAEPIERSQATLRAAVEQTGKSWNAYKGKVEDAIKTGENYGHGAADTQEALAKLTLGFKDPQKALDEMSRAETLAGLKHISLAEAAAALVKNHAGANKVLKEFGINVKDSTTLLADATKADKAYAAALGPHEKAVQHLSDLEAIHAASRKKLTLPQEFALRDARKAVAETTDKLAAATTAKAAAETAATGATASGEKILNKLLDTNHAADLQAKTFGGTLLALKTRVGDFAGEWGSKAGPVLAGAGPALMTVGGIMQLVTMFTGAHTAATAVDTVAVEANTSVGLLGRIGMAAGAVVTGIMTAAQWALNVALNANPIGLVVIAVAALIGGVILAYTHIGWFRNFVNGLWMEIRVLWGWLSQNLLPILGTVAGVIGGAVVGAVRGLVSAFQSVASVVTAVWNAFQGFVGFLSGAFKAALGAISGPIKAVGDALNALNPLAHHSPSLVENVIAGTDIIKGRYTSLSGMQLQGPSLGGIKAGAMPSLATAMAGGGAGGGSGGLHVGAVNVYNPIPETASTSTARELRKLAYLGQAT
jgi:hypothetical protein